MTKETEVTAAPEPALRTADRGDPEKVEIVEDVEIVDDDEPISGVDNDDPRSAIYARHAKNREREIDGEADELEEGEGGAGADDGEIDVEKAETADIIEEGQGASTPPDEADDPLIEVVIFDQVRQVPQSKIDKAGGVQMYQMREAAYEQMRRNAERAKELDNRENALDERERSAAQPPAVPAMDQQRGQPPGDLPSDDQSLETMARQYQDAVYEGDDNAPSILARMVATAARTGETFDKDDFRRQVKEEVLADQRKAKVVKARQALFDEAPELDKRRPDKFDHRLYQAVDDETDVLERQHPDWEPEQVIKAAWDNVRKWHGHQTTETMDAKNKDKRELTRPRSATGRHKPPPPPPRQTNSDYVHQQRVARGLEPE